MRVTENGVNSNLILKARSKFIESFGLPFWV